MTEQTNVPKLRFSGFEGAWVDFLFEQICSLRKEKHNPATSDKTFPCIELEHLSQKTGEILGVVDSIHQKSTKSVFQPGDVLFGKLRPYLKKYAQPNFKGVCSTEIWVLNGNEAINTFLFYFIQCETFSFHVESTTGTKMPRAEWNYLKSNSFYIPHIQEQQKIASFLSKVDAKISLLSEKKAKLTEYKKGAMQQLFDGKWLSDENSQDEKPVFIPPTLRFKADDGSEFGEWEEKALGDVVSIKSPKFVPNSDNQLPCIELDNLSQGTGKIIGTMSIDGFKSQKNIFHTGNVLFGKLRPYLKKFAFPAFSGVCSSEIWVMSSLETLQPSYLFQLVQTDVFLDEANKSTGTKMPRADWKVMSIFGVNLPCKEEQEKIANFLTTIDKKIDLTNTELEKAKDWKKGLLQQMFV